MKLRDQIFFNAITIAFTLGLVSSGISLDGRSKSKLRKIRDVAHESQQPHPGHVHPHHSRRHVRINLDYDKLLKSFGVEDSSTHANSPFSDPETQSSTKTLTCKELHCGHGRICRTSAATNSAECICRERCSTQKNPVCGSDGRLYLNHCELYRTSCLINKTIHMIPSQGTTCNEEKNSAILLDSHTASTSATFQASCSESYYGHFKEKLMLYFYDRLASVYRRDDSSMDKYGLLKDIFEIFDSDADKKLTQQELKRQQDWGLEKLSLKCHLQDLLRNEDSNGDDELELFELYQAYGLPGLDVRPATESLRQWSASVGNTIEIPCGLSTDPKMQITWERNQVTLTGDQEDATGIRIDRSDTLYFTHAQLIHNGNYSCYSQLFPQRQLTHSLRITMAPAVEIAPRQRFYNKHDEAKLKCHVVGIPRSKVKWLKNELEIDSPKGNEGVLEFKSLKLKDTGTYTCKAENPSGTTSAVSSVFVVDQLNGLDTPRRNYLAVLHAYGISFFDPADCRLRFRILKNDIIPGTSNDRVCGSEVKDCEWGGSVNVMDKYIYATQPTLNRVISISLEQMIVVQVIPTDHVPVKVSYVPHLDQLWVLCWTSIDDSSDKSIQIIRDASTKTFHTAIHPEPLNGKFPIVDAMFIPSVQELAHKFSHAYASTTRGLFKVDMRTLKFVKEVDLEKHQCRPRKVTFSALGGFVFIDCVDSIRGTPKGQITLDYLTDAVIRNDESINGQTFISPDNQYWVNLGTDILRVQEITETGLHYLYDVASGLHIADVTFHPSHSNFSYDLYATGLSKDRMLILELASNRLSTVPGIRLGTGRKFNRWMNPDLRFISSSGVFGGYVASASKNAVFVTNTESRTINCEIADVEQPQFAVWIEYPPPEV